MKQRRGGGCSCVEKRGLECRRDQTRAPNSSLKPIVNIYPHWQEFWMGWLGFWVNIPTILSGGNLGIGMGRGRSQEGRDPE